MTTAANDGNQGGQGGQQQQQINTQDAHIPGYTIEGGDDFEQEGGQEGQQDGQQQQQEKAPPYKPGYIDEKSHQRQVNKQHKKFRDEQRRADQLERELTEAKERLAKLGNDKPVEIPPLPDPFDPQYKEKVEARDKAIEASVTHRQQLQQAEEAKNRAEQAKQQDQQNAVIQQMQDYQGRIKTLGLDLDELEKAENVVIQYVQDPQIRTMLLTEENGPLMVKFLAENPIEADNLAGLSTTGAAIYLKQKIEPEAIKLKPKPSGAAPPLEIDEGANLPERVDPLLKGMRIE